MKTTMFKDEEVFSKFNKEKTAQFTKSSIAAMIFDKQYQRVRLKLMKSFETTKKNLLWDNSFWRFCT